jgi:hypothetical protein
MGRWVLILTAGVLALPLFAQRGRSTDPEFDDLRDQWEYFDVEGIQGGAFLPLRLGRDRRGVGLRARASVGWDDNLFRTEQDREQALFADAGGDAFLGSRVGPVVAGVRGLAAGRVHFGDKDADMWDLKFGAFLRVPYDGGIGFGLSADALYQQLQTYEVTGPLVRRRGLKVGGAIARAHVGLDLGRVIPEVGLTGTAKDFSEESDIRSLDHWSMTLDAGAYLDLGLLRVRPYASLDYSDFRDQVERRRDGSRRDDNDGLSLISFDYGLEVQLELGVLRAGGEAYAVRLDDTAGGFDRYWQFGARGAAALDLTPLVMFTAGADVWSREYDVRLAEPGSGRSAIERYGGFYGELSWNFWEFFHLGGRVAWARRTSSIPEGGYREHQVWAFLEARF